MVEGPEPGDLIPLNPIHSLKDLEGHLGFMSGTRDDLVVALSTGDFRMLEQPMGDLLRENGVDEVDKESSAYRRLAVAIHQAETQLNLIQQQHLQCDFSYRERLPQIFPDAFGRKEEIPPSPPPGPVNKLSQVFNEFWPKHKKKLAVRTIPENERSYSRFLAFAGEDTDIKAITKEMCRNTKRMHNRKTRSETKVNNQVPNPKPMDSAIGAKNRGTSTRIP